MTEAETRAEQALFEYLDAKQLVEWEQKHSEEPYWYRTFTVRGNLGGVYQLRTYRQADNEAQRFTKDYTAIYKLHASGKYLHFCFQVERGLPGADNLLALKLMVEGNEGFIHEEKHFHCDTAWMWTPSHSPGENHAR